MLLLLLFSLGVCLLLESTIIQRKDLSSMSNQDRQRLALEYNAALRQRAYQAAQARYNRLRETGQAPKSLHDCLPEWYVPNLRF